MCSVIKIQIICRVLTAQVANMRQIMSAEWLWTVICEAAMSCEEQYVLLDHFGDESFQAIDCTGTDNQKQGNKTA